MANSKFDFSKLKPVSDKGSSVFDPSQLKAVEEPQSDEMPEEESWYAKLPRNIVAGLGQMQRRLFNAPHDVTEQLENSLQGLGAPFMNMELQQLMKRNPHNPLSSHIPHQSEKDFARFFGQQGEGTLLDNLIQKGVEYAPEIGSLPLLLRKGATYLPPITQKLAARKLGTVEKSLQKAGGYPVPINSKLINQSKEFLPKTVATREMLKGAKLGEYPHSFAMQSQIGRHERALSKSPLPADRLLAPQARELKQAALSDIEKGLRSFGLHKEAELLKGGINDYRKYIKFRDTVLPVLKKAGIPIGTGALGALGYKTVKKMLS